VLPGVGRTRLIISWLGVRVPHGPPEKQWVSAFPHRKRRALHWPRPHWRPHTACPTRLFGVDQIGGAACPTKRWRKENRPRGPLTAPPLAGCGAARATGRSSASQAFRPIGAPSTLRVIVVQAARQSRHSGLLGSHDSSDALADCSRVAPLRPPPPGGWDNGKVLPDSSPVPLSAWSGFQHFRKSELDLAQHSPTEPHKSS